MSDETRSKFPIGEVSDEKTPDFRTGVRHDDALLPGLLGLGRRRLLDLLHLADDRPIDRGFRDLPRLQRAAASEVVRRRRFSARLDRCLLSDLDNFFYLRVVRLPISAIGIGLFPNDGNLCGLPGNAPGSD